MYALADVPEGEELPPLLAPPLAVVGAALPGLEVHRVGHDVLQLHQLHGGGLLHADLPTLIPPSSCCKEIRAELSTQFRKTLKPFVTLERRSITTTIVPKLTN